MSGLDRLQTELTFHDDQARGRADTFRRAPDALCFADDEYLDHETWIRPAFARLGNVQGLRVLDYGCGHGMAAVVLARAGACVTAFDLSPGYLAEARRRAAANGVTVTLAQADGARLPFADASFDRVWGSAILHHLDLGVAGRELWRVLKPGGCAVFCEPWGENPFLNWARRHAPYPGKARTPDEEPLQRKHLRVLRNLFPAVEIRGYQFLAMLRRVVRNRRLGAALDRCDRTVLRLVPALETYCRYVVLTLRRGPL